MLVAHYKLHFELMEVRAPNIFIRCVEDLQFEIISN